MGKRRRARPTGQKAAWDPESQVVLLGLLDFCIKHKRVLPFNEENVVGRLCPSDHPSDIYTWDQINRKLEYIWRHLGENDSPNKTDIYVTGSACLAGLGKHERSAIQLEVERLEKLLRPRTRGKKAFDSPATRKSTSEGPYAVKRSQSHASEWDISSIGRLTPRAQRHQARELAKQSKRERDTSEGSLLGDDTPRKRTRQIKKGVSAGSAYVVFEANLLTTPDMAVKPQNSCKHQAKQGSEDLERETRHQVRQRLLVEDSELEPSSGNENDSNLFVTPIPGDRGIHKFTSLRLGSEVIKLQGDQVPYPAVFERIHKAALRKKDEMITELEETIEANKAKLDELQAQLDSFGSVQDRRQDGGHSLELHLSNLNQEIRHLKKAKNDCRNIGTFTKLAGSYEAARQEMNMEAQVPYIRRLMKNILGGCDDDTALQIPGSHLTAGLRSLLSFAFWLDDQVPLQKDQLELLLSNRPPYSIIEALIEAAVCTWIFESSFPNFEQQTMVSQLFTKYRELIATQDGAVALRNLELASYHALINTPQFLKEINTTAESLATSLSKTLAPFFARNAEESEENVFETWAEEEDTWKARRNRLVAIFKISLMLKANSLLTPEQYELVRCAPDTKYDPATMNVETIDGAPTGVEAGEDHEVEHCLHVAILAYTREKVKDTDPVSKATIQTKNFTRGDQTQPSRVTAPTVLVKAVVVLRRHVDDDAQSDDTVQ